MNGFSARRVAKLLPVIALVALVVPATAFGQATRTWVSGVGDDANPCSRTAPCKTFAGAISKTAAGGQINALDPGGYGGVTITKSITISGRGTFASALVSGTNAIVVNAAATDKVTLRHLDIFGLGTGLNGVRILQAKSVRIENSEISGFVRNAVDFQPVNPNAQLFMVDNFIHNNLGNGLLVAPPSAGTGARAKVTRNFVQDNGCGLTATTFGPDPAFNYASNCGTLASSSGIFAAVSITAIDCGISLNTNAGVMSRGSGGNVRVGRNEITNNLFGLRSVDGGQIISHGGNMVGGNGTDGAPTSTVAPV